MLSMEQIERSLQQRAEQQQSAAGIRNRSATCAGSRGRQAPTAAESLANIAAEGQKYRATVRLALIDAMLDSSKNLELGPDEWLTIAARNSEYALPTNEIMNLTTTLLRVKGQRPGRLPRRSADARTKPGRK